MEKEELNKFMHLRGGAPRCDEQTGLAEDRTRDPPVQAGRFTTRLQAHFNLKEKGFLRV